MSERREIYGIIGAKGHGKDTFAKLVLSHRDCFCILHFAADLKHISSRVFGLTNAQMNDPILKEALLDKPIEIDLFIGALRKETGLQIQPRNKIGRSPREVLQYFGTEYVRYISNDYWVHRILRKIGNKKRFLIPDARFPNECDALRSVGGLIIKILRIDVPPSNDGHASEIESNSITPDLIIGVRTGDLSMPRRIASLIAMNKFESALRYDYNRARTAMTAYVSGESAEASSRLLGSNHKDPYCLYNILDYYGIPRRRHASNQIPHQMVNDLECKICGKCKELKPIGDFHSCTKNWDGLMALCRSCGATANRERYHRYGKVDSLQKIFATAKRSAKARDILFELVIDDVHVMWERQKGCCFYSGRLMATELSNPNKVTIDRVDSTKGYTTGNVVLCCYIVNIMKHNLPVLEFRTLIEDIHKFSAKTA